MLSIDSTEPTTLPSSFGRISKSICIVVVFSAEWLSFKIWHFVKCVDWFPISCYSMPDSDDCIINHIKPSIVSNFEPAFIYHSKKSEKKKESAIWKLDLWSNAYKKTANQLIEQKPDKTNMDLHLSSINIPIKKHDLDEQMNKTIENNNRQLVRAVVNWWTNKFQIPFY